MLETCVAYGSSVPACSRLNRSRKTQLSYPRSRLRQLITLLLAGVVLCGCDIGGSESSGVSPEAERSVQ
jgi:hypothetical protein